MEHRRRAWTSDTQATLIAAGWTLGRCERARVEDWRARLETPSGFKMSEVAGRVLAEFGGIRASSSGPGRQSARGGFVLDPMSAAGEEDRFAAFESYVASPLFPLGETDDGHAFLGIDDAGAVYLVGDALHRLGDDIYAALDAILEGGLATLVADRGRW